MAAPWANDPVADKAPADAPAGAPWAQDAPADEATLIDRPKPTDPPIIISAIRPQGALKSQEVNPTYDVHAFGDQNVGDKQYHTALSDDDKKEYAAFFKDPAHPPSPAQLGLWYHQKTGSYLANAQDIVDAFKKTGKFQTREHITVPAQHETAPAAYLNHTANALALDWAPELVAPLDALGLGGKDRPNVWNSDQGFGKLVANNADLERAQLDQDSADHPYASIGGELTGAAAGAVLGNEAGLANLGRGARVATTAAESAAYGAGAAGPGHRGEGALTGAALGGATEAAAPFVKEFLAAKKAGDVAAATRVAQAAHDLGIDLPRFIVGGERDAKRASALEQTIGGSKPISDATSRMLDQAGEVRTGIASSVGNAAEPAAMGDEALNGAVANVKSERARIGNIYDQARTAAGGTIFEATQTEKTLQQLVDQENQVLGGTKAGTVFKSLLDDLKNRAGKLTIDGARDTRTELRTRLRDEAGVTPDNADRLTNMVMDSVNGDIESGLLDKGMHGAIPLYRQADREWAGQRSLEDDVLKPFLGKNFDNWGEDVAKKINSDAKGNGTRLARFLGAIPEENANNVRASIIMHLGSAADGAQNAAGDRFSLDTFLTNWNKIKGARNLILPKESVQALDKLATVAEAVKAAGRTKNRSNTGGVMSYLVSGAPITGGAAETLMTGDPKGVALGMLFSGLNAVRQYGAAKLLASPAFAKKLAATPMNAAGAKAFWSRPWVKALTTKNPAIAGEIQAFQHAFLSHANDNSGIVSSAAASSNPDSEEQQQ